MKTLIAIPLLAMAACISPGSGMLPTGAEGPVARTVERVIQRVEDFANEDPPMVAISDGALAYIMDMADQARAMVLQPAASGEMLQTNMAELMDLHDAMVHQAWMQSILEPYEVKIYLQDTIRLRSLFDAVSIHS